MKPVGYGGRDSPDFGIGDVGQGLSVMIDGAELAARLGSILSFSRTGNLLYQDSFDYGLGSWDIDDNDGDGTAKIYTSSAYRSPYCVRLQCLDDFDSYVSMSKSFGYPYLCNVGMEITFRVNTSVFDLRFTGEMGNSDKKVEFGLWLRSSTELLHYYTEVGSWLGEFENVADIDSPEHFHTLKLVVDLVNDKYLFALFNNVRYTMLYPDLKTSEGVSYPYIDFTIKSSQDTEQETIIFIDDFIYTINEPT